MSVDLITNGDPLDRFESFDNLFPCKNNSNAERAAAKALTLDMTTKPCIHCINIVKQQLKPKPAKAVEKSPSPIEDFLGMILKNIEELKQMGHISDLDSLPEDSVYSEYQSGSDIQSLKTCVFSPLPE